jgi:hypothetical protein
MFYFYTVHAPKYNSSSLFPSHASSEKTIIASLIFHFLPPIIN